MDPFSINSETGIITIADPSSLSGDQVWQLVVRVTDEDLITDDATITVNVEYGWLLEAISELGGFSQDADIITAIVKRALPTLFRRS